MICRALPRLVLCAAALLPAFAAQAQGMAPSTPTPAQPPALPGALPLPVSDTLARVKIPESGLGALVVRINDGAVMVAHNADRAMQPASTMKLVTTIAGLHMLGPTFRARTALLTNGTQKDDILFGDLVLRGGGDTDFDTAALLGMLQTLRHKGIRHIRGDLVIDRSLYLPGRLDAGVPPFDETPEFRYNVIPDTLNLNLNLHRLDLSADGETLRASLWPSMDKVKLKNAMTLVDAPCKDWDNGWKMPLVEKVFRDEIRVTLQGTFPRNCAKVTEINVIDRNEYAARLLRSLWKQLGGSMRGDVVDGVAPVDARILAEHVSRPLSELVRDINKPSDNTFARILYLNLGTYAVENVIAAKAAPLPAEGDTLTRADRRLRDWMQAQGIDPQGMVVENGSGLSRLERISPLQMAALLKIAHQSIWAPEFKASLPLAGMDGTMRARLKDSPAAGRARVKTGTLRNVTANAGYVLDGQGREYIFVAMVNSDTMKAAEGRAVLDSLIDWVARIDAPVSGVSLTQK